MKQIIAYDARKPLLIRGVFLGSSEIGVMTFPILIFTASNVVLRLLRALVLASLDNSSALSFWGERLQARLTWKKSEQSGIGGEFVVVAFSSFVSKFDIFCFFEMLVESSSLSLGTYNLGWRIEEEAWLHASSNLLSSFCFGAATLNERNQRVLSWFGYHSSLEYSTVKGRTWTSFTFAVVR